MPDSTAGVVMDAPLNNLDIDTEFDWVVAEQAIRHFQEEPMKTFIIAEAGVNHNGSDDTGAASWSKPLRRCGADAVKFQTFTAEKLVRPGAEKAEYQKRETGDGDQLDMLKKLEMSEELHRKLIQRCKELNIEFMSTPFDEQAADFLVRLV